MIQYRPSVKSVKTNREEPVIQIQSLLAKQTLQRDDKI